MKHRKIVAGLLGGLLFIAAACSSSGEAEAVPVEVGLPPTEPAQVMGGDTAQGNSQGEVVTATPEPTEEAGPAETNNVAAGAIQADTESDSEAAPATSEPPAVTVMPTPAPSSDEASSGVQTIDQVAAVESYRQQVHIVSQSANGSDTINMINERVEDPLAYHNKVTFEQNSGDQSNTETVEVIYVDGVSYISSGDTWSRSDQQVMNIEDLTRITPEEVAGLIGQMDEGDIEEVEGRSAVRYSADEAILPQLASSEGGLDPDQFETASIDVWVDQELNAVTRLNFAGAANSGDTDLSFVVLIVYYDFNDQIEISVPDEAANAEQAPADAPLFPQLNSVVESTGAAEAVNALLGFELPLPADSTLDVMEEGTLVAVHVPYTAGEAADLIEKSLPDNGYELVNQVGSAEDQLIYTFNQGNRVLTVTVEPSDDGSTSTIQFATE